MHDPPPPLSKPLAHVRQVRMATASARFRPSDLEGHILRITLRGGLFALIVILLVLAIDLSEVHVIAPAVDQKIGEFMLSLVFPSRS